MFKPGDVELDVPFGVDFRLVQLGSVVVTIIIVLPSTTIIAIPVKGGNGSQFEADVIVNGKRPIKGFKFTVNLRDSGFTLSFTDKEGQKILNGSRQDGSWHMATLTNLGK